ncbi:AAA family ATPase [Chloroflexi bacterium TSY]|nr:AAA family ATPase [Chloroflexi bacterium TSY]
MHSRCSHSSNSSVSLNPLHEPAHRQLMLLYAWADQQTAALRQYRECERLLQEELGVAPDAATVELFEVIKTGHIAAPVATDGQEATPSSSGSPLTLVNPPRTIPQPEDPPHFVGRKRELEQLADCLDSALSGQGQILFVTGEAGAGKTALVSEFAHHAQENYDDLLVAYGNCNAQTGISDPYLPFRELLSMLTGDTSAMRNTNADEEQTLHTGIAENNVRLQSFVTDSGRVLVEHGPDLINRLVSGNGLAQRVQQSTMQEMTWVDRLETLVQQSDKLNNTSVLDQNRIFEQVTAVLQMLAMHRPLLLVLDDLHWIDESSANLLFHLARRIGESRLLLVGTYRPEDVAQTPSGKRHSLQQVTSEIKRQQGDIWISLNRLPRADLRDFVDRVIDREPNRLGEDFRQELFRHTSGQALFTVELLRTMQEDGALIQDHDGRWIEGERLEWTALPAKVEGVIEKRIGQLDDDLRELLTVASVEGEEFTVELVAQVLKRGVRPLVRQLGNELERRHRVVVSEGITMVGNRRLSRFRFRHNLFQTYLYQQMNEIERTYLHDEVGSVLESLFVEQTSSVAVQLAWHFQQAGLFARAVPYLLTAGLKAAASSAHHEAIRLFTQGLELVESVSNPTERLDLEIQLQIGLAESLHTMHGYTSATVEAAWLRARDLCQQADDKIQLGRALWWIANSYWFKGELTQSQQLIEQVLTIAQETDDRQLSVQSHHMMAMIAESQGNFSKGKGHMDQALALVDWIRPITDKERVGRANQLLGNAASLLLYAGYPDQALLRVQESMRKMQENEYLFEYVSINTIAASVHIGLRQPEVAQPLVEQALAVSNEEGYIYWSARGRGVLGQSLIEQGRIEEGIDAIDQSLTLLQDLNTEYEQLCLGFIASQADGYGRLGRSTEGIALLEQLLDRMGKRGQRRFEAETHRIYGELLRMQNASASTIEERFRLAIEIARHQKGKLFELRAALNLARLWQEQERIAEAYHLLSSIYDWFTEGFDTVELKQARRLLTELSDYY